MGVSNTFRYFVKIKNLIGSLVCKLGTVKVNAVMLSQSNSDLNILKVTWGRYNWLRSLRGSLLFRKREIERTY